MKTSKLTNIAWVFFALALTSTTVLAQGRRTGNGYYQNQRNNCVNYISGLTDTQQEQIQQMENNHQLAMNELRTKQRATINTVEKSEIRTEMLKKVEAHRTEVRNLLTEEQQIQYDQLQANSNYARNQNIGRGRGNFSGNQNLQGNFCRANNRENSYAQRGLRGNRGNLQASNYRNNKKSWNQGRGNGRFNRFNYTDVENSVDTNEDELDTNK
nr:Spy/CpxP family protein refolding chaperone [uncultured Draconibacterium sp.]